MQIAVTQLIARLKLVSYLQDNGFSHFEEPCPYWELEQTKAVTDALEIDVTGGEQDCDIPTGVE